MPKKRSQSCYNRKFKKVADWYNRLLKCREKSKTIRINEKGDRKEVERKSIKSLDFYLEKIKKPNN